MVENDHNSHSVVAKSSQSDSYTPLSCSLSEHNHATLNREARHNQ